MFRSFITIAAVAGLVAGASAQQQMPAASVHQASSLKYGTFDFDNGFTATSGSNRAAGPDVLFSTMGTAVYYYSTSGSTLQEWTDEAQLPNRGVTKVEEVNGMSWEYCGATGLGYFDVLVNLYNDSEYCVGPSTWTPGVVSYGTCAYLVSGLPDGCWGVSIDLSCGNECVLPDASNPLSLAGGTIGWSVASYTPGSGYSGPILLKQTSQAPGSFDAFQWQDRSGTWFGSGAYYNAGCYYFGGGGPVAGSFPVGFDGSPVDTVACYGSAPKDILCLQAETNPTAGSSMLFHVEGLPAAGATRATMILQKDDAVGGVAGCEQASMSGGSFTRQVVYPGTIKITPIVHGSASQAYSLAGTTAGKRAILQVVAWSGTSGYQLSKVVAVSNGLDTRL